MQTEIVKLSDLKHPELNPRKHPVKQLNEFMRSIEKYGQYRPFVIDENNVVYVGNGMLDAMVQLGMKEGMAYRLKGMREEDKNKLMLSDNKIYQYGIEALDAIDELMASFSDFDIPGFDEDILEGLYSDDEAADDDVLGYGTLPDDFIHSRQELAKNREEIYENYNPQEPKKVEYTTPIQDEYHGAEKVSYIICPKCGEKIAI